MKQTKKEQKKASLPYFSSPGVHFTSRDVPTKRKINRRTLENVLK